MVLLVLQESRRGCIVEELEEFPQFRSEGHRAVQIGPRETVGYYMWD